MTEIIREEQYEKEMKEIAEPKLSAARKKGIFTTDKKITLNYEWYARERAKGNILILHGYTESAEKYREMMYYFLEEGYQVFALDLRGHGYSAREVMPTDVTHIDHMDDYIEDLHSFVEKIVKRNNRGLPVYLYAHSMGGAIGILYQMAYPGTFRRLVLSSPMIAPVTGEVPMFAAKAIASYFVKTGQGKAPMAGAVYYKAPEYIDLRGKNSKARLLYYAGKRERDENYHNYCPTYSWIYQACCAKKRILKKKNLRKITEPVLLFQAECDDVVKLPEQSRFVRSLPDGRLVRMPGVMHAIYMSDDETVREYLAGIFAFLSGKEQGQKR